jgi:predicted AlkP superfamily pyrophosphatase or phosphodiesterase
MFIVLLKSVSSKKMKRLNIVLFFLLLTAFSFLRAQSTNPEPKLVVGIVIDQMRYDYLYRFESLYGKDGFKKLMKEGTNFTFAHFNYVPTYTGPGHSCIYTGTTPYFNGIISNDWYDKETRKMVYCVEDKSVKTLGADDKNGEMSPRRLQSTTITDQLKIATNGSSKVISISLKDRAAIMIGGHMADAAYWYDPDSGNYISSTYYMKQLPEWVINFNKKRLADKYVALDWNLSYPLDRYVQTLPDAENYEEDVFSEGKTTFPHTFKNLSFKKKYDVLRTTPFANDLQYDFIKVAINNEKLGQHSNTDFLAISYCASDYVGHAYGPNSVEVEDLYVKLDSLIANMISFLDSKVGKGKYILFLTADHAVVPSPDYEMEKRIPGGWLNPEIVKDSLMSFTEREFHNKKLIEIFSNLQIYFSRRVIKDLNLNLSNLESVYVNYLRDNFPLVTQIFKRDDLEKQIAGRADHNFLLNGFNPVRSGDVLFGLQSGYIFEKAGEVATSHGTLYSYDTHVPLIFYGWHIPAQTVNSPVYTVDIAPTIANLLKIQEPSACIGIPIIK